jgi:hypothetical protein
MAQACQTMSSTSDLLRRFNRAQLDYLVNSNAELVFILHLNRNSIRQGCPFRSNLIGSSRPQPLISTFDGILP